MNIALVDDERSQLDFLKCEIEKVMAPIECQISLFQSGEAFLESFESGKYDLITLDIYMDKMDGIQVAYKIRETDSSVRIVFCTSSNEYASESYAVGAFHYLHKPIFEHNVEELFGKLRAERLKDSRVICLPDGKEMLLQNILYTEYENHTVTLYQKTGDSHKIRISQSEIEEILFETGYFHSPYKGITVNFFCIEHLSDECVRLHGNTELPLTRRRAKEFKEAYNKFKFEQMRKEVGV